MVLQIDGCSMNKSFNNTRGKGSPTKKVAESIQTLPKKLLTPLHPLQSNGQAGALYFRADLSKCHLNFNFHCISAPNHPGKGSDPPNQANAPLNMDNSSQK